MIRYGPALCVILLLLSTLPIISIKKKWKIHFFSGSVFFICALLILMSYLDFNKFQSEQFYFLNIFRVNSMSLVIAFTFFIVNLLMIWFSKYALNKYISELEYKRYFGSIFIMNASITIILFLDDTFWIYFAYMLVILMSYNLVIIKKDIDIQYEKIKFIVLNFFGLCLLLVGLIMLRQLTGTTSIHLLNQYINDDRMNYLTLSVTLCIIGLGVNGALFPFYSWMPNLYSKLPPPLSAQLSAITIKVAPIIMMKIVFDGLGLVWFSKLQMDRVFIVLGILSMLSGSIFAIYQRNIKKMIAYSTIAQLGYIYLGIGFANFWGIRIAIYQIIAHALTKSAIYLSVSSIYEQTGTTEIDALRGIGKEMPVTLVCFSMAALSMIGIPLLPGFINKWYLSLSSLSNGLVIPVFVILISTVLNATYYLPIIINGYYGKNNVSHKIFFSKAKPVKEVIPLIILVVIMVLLGIFSNLYFQLNPVYYH